MISTTIDTMQTIGDEAEKARLQGQAQARGHAQLTAQRQAPMEANGNVDEQGDKQVQRQQTPPAGAEIVGQVSKQEEQEPDQQQQSQIDDWSKSKQQFQVYQTRHLMIV